jgi:tRNA(Arg) A34 adenosine deaminase TadA
MASNGGINRRDMIVTTAEAAGAAAALAGGIVTPALGQTSTEPPAGFVDQKPFKAFWQKALSDVVRVDLKKAAPELADDAVKERHRIYCHLLMKLIHRFWNGNKRGPFGDYPLRAKQVEVSEPPTQRYRGDTVLNPGGSRQNWDRYVGHNIACLAVDGNGEIIDFDFNHNEFFRSSAEHAESRMVRRLFSLTNIYDSWQTGHPIGSRPALLNDVTLYTSLESCAQCSGVMSLAGIKQVIFLQNDFTAYMIGNIMFNLANSVAGAPGAPIPIAASEIGLKEFGQLNQANLKYAADMVTAAEKNDSDMAFFISADKSTIEFDPGITSFLCTDVAHDIFEGGGNVLDSLKLAFPDRRSPNPSGASNTDVLTNAQCLEEARSFYNYADIEGYRGSPHKL